MAGDPMELTIGGVRFRPAGVLTLARDVWMSKWIRRAGLDAIPAVPKDATAADVEALYRTLIGNAFEADAVVPLLAGALERVEAPWSEAQAAETMALLAAEADPATKDRLLGAFAELLAGFLEREPAWLRSTLLYSAPPATETDASPRTPAPASPMPTAASGAT